MGSPIIDNLIQAPYNGIGHSDYRQRSTHTVMVAQPHRTLMSVEDYLTLDRDSVDTRYEYIDGYAYMMSGGTLNHSTISINVTSLFRNLLRDSSCRVYNSDARVRLSYQSANCGRIRRRSSQTRRRNDMPRVTRAAAHLSSEEVKQRLKTDPRPWCRQRWLIIYNALIEPRKAEEIARHCGVSKATVHEVISTYNRLGIAAVETAGKGGRRREYLTLEEEEQFLAPFFARAESGAIATVAQIQAAFEEQVGHEVDDSTIYRLLNRHGWRKLMPRPRHPQANLQAQEQFKKNLKRRLKRQSQRGQSKMSAPS